MAEQHPKRDYLVAAGALCPHSEAVRADLFQRHRFFDPLDKVQVKYEMLRAHTVDGMSVAAAAAAFGFSRETFYQTLHAFEDAGIPGLRDEKRGRRGPVKLTAEIIVWIHQTVRRHPDWSGAAIARELAREWGLVVHRRTIERLLVEGRKKNV